MESARFLVTGTVQGVFFRASTQARARELGLSGIARNLGDGRVEVVARGTPEALEHLHRWLHEGPPSARVASVLREKLDEGAMPAHDRDDFSTR